MRILKYFLPFMLLCISSRLSAHALWIETSATGTIGRQQEVKIFFGEYSTGDVSPADKWFSDLKDFTLVLVTPGKKEIKLSTTAANEYYTASFTPEEGGTYTLVMHHLTKDIYRNMKLDYHSSAVVRVGKSTAADTAAYNSNAVSVITNGQLTAKANRQVSLKVFNNAMPAGRQKVKVIAPNGWEKEITTDSKGQLEFVPLWPGKYMADYAYIEKIPGEYNGKKYEETWKIATYIIEVK
jgi:uncharacterized GH25 family protein